MKSFLLSFCERGDDAEQKTHSMYTYEKHAHKTDQIFSLTFAEGLFHHISGLQHLVQHHLLKRRCFQGNFYRTFVTLTLMLELPGLGDHSINLKTLPKVC